MPTEVRDDLPPSMQRRALRIIQEFADRSPEDSAERCVFCKRTAGHNPHNHAARCIWRRAWLFIWAAAKPSLKGHQRKGRPHVD